MEVTGLSYILLVLLHRMGHLHPTTPTTTTTASLTLGPRELLVARCLNLLKRLHANFVLPRLLHHFLLAVTDNSHEVATTNTNTSLPQSPQPPHQQHHHPHQHTTRWWSWWPRGRSTPAH